MKNEEDGRESGREGGERVETDPDVLVSAFSKSIFFFTLLGRLSGRRWLL